MCETTYISSIIIDHTTWATMVKGSNISEGKVMGLVLEFG